MTLADLILEAQIRAYRWNTEVDPSDPVNWEAFLRGNYIKHMVRVPCSRAEKFELNWAECYLPWGGQYEPGIVHPVYGCKALDIF